MASNERIYPDLFGFQEENDKELRESKEGMIGSLRMPIREGEGAEDTRRTIGNLPDGWSREPKSKNKQPRDY